MPDGNGKTISGLSIDNTKKYQAFVGYAKGAEVAASTISGSLKTSDQARRRYSLPTATL